MAVERFSTWSRLMGRLDKLQNLLWNAADWTQDAALGGSGAVLYLLGLAGIPAAILTYFLWNGILPEVIGVKAVTFWQAWGIVFLSRAIFRR